MNKIFIILFSTLFVFTISCCVNNPTDGSDENAFVALLTNQVDQVIIPTMTSYQEATEILNESVQNLVLNLNEESIETFTLAYENAYLSYQEVAVHNYFATETQALVINTNLYPIDVNILNDLIENESYNFNTSAQERANGFPVIDYMLYGNGSDGFLAYLNEDAKRLSFLNELIASMKERAYRLVDNWTGSLRMNFIDNGGVALGSSVSVQLNNTIIYYEEHIRENKVGIPIGLLGPNDSPIPPDSSLIESYYQAKAADDESFTLSLLKASIEEMEDIYLGIDGQGYDDLLIEREKESIDIDIKELYSNIYSIIDERVSISGDDELYQAIQELITLYKSDLFPVLNVQDADGASDGD